MSGIIASSIMAKVDVCFSDLELPPELEARRRCFLAAIGDAVQEYVDAQVAQLQVEIASKP